MSRFNCSSGTQQHLVECAHVIVCYTCPIKHKPFQTDHMHDPALYRKYFHIASTTPFLLLVFEIDSHVSRQTVVGISACLFVLIGGVEAVRLLVPRFNETMFKRFGFMFKESERTKLFLLSGVPSICAF